MQTLIQTTLHERACAARGMERASLAEGLPRAGATMELGVWLLMLALVVLPICPRRGRVYLPADWLRRAGLTPDEILAGGADRVAVAEVVAQLLQIADNYYRSADNGMRAIPGRYRLAILVASRVYRSIGVRLSRSGCDSLAGRTVVPAWERALWASRAIAVGLGPRMLGLRRNAAHDAALHHPIAGWPGANPAAWNSVSNAAR